MQKCLIRIGFDIGELLCLLSLILPLYNYLPYLLMVVHDILHALLVTEVDRLSLTSVPSQTDLLDYCYKLKEGQP